jgi:Ca-activated chloride channel family protein
MTLLAPVASGFVALSAPIILMYILKLRRQPKVVSSTLLWRKALDDVQANAPWQRLRVSTLLLLQLLALVALVVVQTRPAYSSTERFKGDLVLIVDQSFGMQARDVKPNRFAVAQAQAKTLASEVASGNVVSVIGMGAHPILAIAEGTNQGSIDGAIDSLKVGSSSPNFLEALSLASSLARSGQATHAVVLTSRESGISTLPLNPPFAVQIIRIGANLHDIGIAGFGVSTSHGVSSALVRLENFGYVRAQTDLNLYADGQLADVRPIALGPGAQSIQLWTNLPTGADVLHAVLTSRDDVSADKQAWALVSPAQTRRVLLVTKGDYLLQTALSVNPAVRVTAESAARYTGAQARRFDLIVFDGYLPPTLPGAPALLLSPPVGTVGPLTFGSYAASGVVAPNTLADPSLLPVLSNVEVSDVTVARERIVTMPGWMQPLFTAGSRALIAAGDSGSNRFAIGTFRLQDSDWPLRVSFPILIQNLVQYLVPSVGVSATAITAGDAVSLTPEPGVKQLDVTSPTGVTTTVKRPFPPFTSTATAGVYTVREQGRRFMTRFVVNLLPARPARAIGPRVLNLGSAGGGGGHRTTTPNELGWIAALFCLGVLGTEWWLAFRR